ncbi:hypothetical protein ASPWEDRAFT_173703 [Aspergillus wentii DTO 134E9]|uniref:Polynucleotide adenylyltransferase n=1 Tax=Aspergillus wentii DTO 134E9 TaxID=1073089 RepID=A0A1L9RH68_ASPWE|nr:uncharacterized protein ASPWEDRAFT_173703 [Aspergillus wentii DTO 134E9]KAI9928054.1 hypothetical protein MW887_002906 [Aspergillus wentii]OJJ34281.1 hypothetical protein ASPWEDRAFT_173703 [Aspergillus wentii DTO 134E9]
MRLFRSHLPSSLRPRISLRIKPSNRGFHESLGYSQPPEIFTNSLQKTLEAHRTSNRANLVRKVINTSEPKGIFRPVIPPENLAGYEPSKETPSEFVSPPSGSVSPPKRTRHSAEKSPSEETASVAFDNQIQWNVDSREDRLEQRPWLYHLGSENLGLSDGPSRLDAEIQALGTYLTPTTREKATVTQLITSIQNLLGSVITHPPQVIGSWRTGFASSHSGVDFILLVEDFGRSVDSIRKPSATRPKALATYHNRLREVERALKQSPQFDGQVHFSGKRNPVVTALHCSTGLKLQFYCGQGLPASIEYLKDYQAEYPAIRPLYMVTRLLLETRGLFGAHTPGIRPDALLMLLAAFCKMNHGRFQRSDSLGDQLLAFLRTYGTAVDLRTTGVAIDPPGFFNAETIREEIRMFDSHDSLPAHLRGQRSLVSLKRTAAAKRNFPAAGQLCIQDPANYMNDLGRACFQTMELQSVFADAHERLRASLHAWEESSGHGSRDSILSHILQVNFDDFEKMRTRIACLDK